MDRSLAKITQKVWISFSDVQSGDCPGRSGCGQLEIQGIVGISQKMQNYLKNHFGDAWKQKTMAYFISNRINPIFGIVEYFRKMKLTAKHFRPFSNHFLVFSSSLKLRTALSSPAWTVQDGEDCLVVRKALLYFSEIIIQLLKDLEGEENFQVLVSARDEQKGDFYLRVVNKGGKIILT